jgi:hypothetical protein
MAPTDRGRSSRTTSSSGSTHSSPIDVLFEHPDTSHSPEISYSFSDATARRIAEVLVQLFNVAIIGIASIIIGGLFSMVSPSVGKIARDVVMALGCISIIGMNLTILTGYDIGIWDTEQYNRKSASALMVIILSVILIAVLGV